MSAPPGGRSLQMFCMLIFNFNADVKKRKKLAGPTCWVQSSKFGHCTDGLPDGSVIRKYARPCGQSARHSAELGKARRSIPHSVGVNPINFDVIIFYYYYYYLFCIFRWEGLSGIDSKWRQGGGANDNVLYRNLTTL